MPNATLTTEAQTYELKTLPADKAGGESGYIKAKPLSYGQKKDRADIAGRVYSELRDQARNNGDNGEPTKMFLESANRASTKYDFEHCIIDHNLEDGNGRKLDFSMPSTYDRLDGRVGTEIENILAKLNGDDETAEEELAFFVRPDNSPTPTEKVEAAK